MSDHVDGNAVIGALSLALGTDLAQGSLECAGCGDTHEIARTHVYLRCPGMVLRCPGCGAVEVVIVEIRHRLTATLSGVAALRTRPAGAARPRVTEADAPQVVTAISIALATRLPMRDIERVHAEAGAGLVGDRYHGSRHRHVSVQSATELARERRGARRSGAARPHPAQPHAQPRRRREAARAPGCGSVGRCSRWCARRRPAGIMDDAVGPGAARAMHDRGARSSGCSSRATSRSATSGASCPRTPPDGNSFARRHLRRLAWRTDVAPLLALRDRRGRGPSAGRRPPPRCGWLGASGEPSWGACCSASPGCCPSRWCRRRSARPSTASSPTTRRRCSCGPPRSWGWAC